MTPQPTYHVHNPFLVLWPEAVAVLPLGHALREPLFYCGGRRKHAEDAPTIAVCWAVWLTEGVAHGCTVYPSGGHRTARRDPRTLAQEARERRRVRLQKYRRAAVWLQPVLDVTHAQPDPAHLRHLLGEAYGLSAYLGHLRDHLWSRLVY